jgi:hypothetical protein
MKRKRDVETGKENREWAIDLINEQGRDFLKCEFVGNSKETRLAIECQLVDYPDKKAILEIRLAKNINALISGYFKGSQDLTKNIKEIQKRIFVLIAERRFSVVPGWEIPLKKFKQAESKGNKNRTIIDMENFLPHLPLHGGGFFDKRNLAQVLFGFLMK